ncbi:MAG TPA: Rv3235 family protein [Streptosporangiaceae bacterium]|nr:Rv3235 family protein [Streptosporangiaceae bacterium]
MPTPPTSPTSPSSPSSGGSRPLVRLISFARTEPGAAGPGATPDDRPVRHPPDGARPRLRAVPADEPGTRDDLAVAARATARAFAEVITGIRPLHHLARRASPEVYDRLGRTIPPTGSAGHLASRMIRVTVPLVQQPVPGAAEVCAVVFTGDRAQALALRLERDRGRWRCVAVETTLSPRQPGSRRLPRPA